MIDDALKPWYVFMNESMYVGVCVCVYIYIYIYIYIYTYK